jgi:DNA (cytosine-5)-methyltransferase 1
MNELHLFAGAGGGILGGMLLGHTCVCAVEIEEYPRKVLLQRQHDGILPKFPIWDDVSTFDGKPWRGRVDIIAGGFPCQDISTAGTGAGIDGERSGLWREMARVIDEVQPSYVFVENSPALTSRGLGVVLGDLAQMGYHARWGVLGAVDVGAPHKRERIWVLAGFPSSNKKRRNRGATEQGAKRRQVVTRDDRMADTMRNRPQRQRQDRTIKGPLGLRCGAGGNQEQNILADSENQRDVRRLGSMGAVKKGNGLARGSEEDGLGEWWATEPNVGRVAHGVAARVDRLKAIGNGQVPAVAALAWRLLGGPVGCQK